MHPFAIVREFEKEVANYTGAPYCVAVNSCTNALFLCLQYMKWLEINCKTEALINDHWEYIWPDNPPVVTIPKFSYISVPMSIKNAGFKVGFRDEEWVGGYQLHPYHIFDCARRFTSNMFDDFYKKTWGEDSTSLFMCTSHHWNKILGIQQGGCILHNMGEDADTWFRKARFDGRTEGVPPSKDRFDMLGWHMYMSPEIAAEGLVRLAHLPKVNADMPNDNYPDLSQIELFK